MTALCRLAPGETAMISREYGQQLEFTGDYPAALLHYERGFLVAGTAGTVVVGGEEVVEHNVGCKAGIAR